MTGDDDTKADAFDGRAATLCKMPDPLEPLDAGILERLLRTVHGAFCARKGEADEGEHRCLGKITIEANRATFQCPRCGDSRRLFGR